MKLNSDSRHVLPALLSDAVTLFQQLCTVQVVDFFASFTLSVPNANITVKCFLVKLFRSSRLKPLRLLPLKYWTLQNSHWRVQL